MIQVAVARDAAHQHAREPGAARPAARAAGLEGDAGQEFHVVVEGFDVELLELFRPDGLHADRHALQVFLALLRGDDHFFEGAVVRLLRERNRYADEQSRGGCERYAAEDRANLEFRARSSFRRLLRVIVALPNCCLHAV